MPVRQLRLFMGIFLLLAGGSLIALQLFAPEIARKLNSPTRLMIGAGLGIVLGGVNIAKWYAGWLAFHERATPVRLPLQPESERREPEEPNPEFDFNKYEHPRDNA